jgi:hypothetical protein
VYVRYPLSLRNVPNRRHDLLAAIVIVWNTMKLGEIVGVRTRDGAPVGPAGISVEASPKSAAASTAA